MNTRPYSFKIRLAKVSTPRNFEFYKPYFEWSDKISILTVRIIRLILIHFVKFPIFILISIHFVKLWIPTVISIHFVKLGIFTLIFIRFINFKINTSISIHITRKLTIFRVCILWRESEFFSHKIELRNRVTQNHVTPWVTNGKMCTEVLLSSY